MNSNGLKTTLLLAGLTGLLLGLGQIFGGSRGLVFGFGVAVLMNVVSYFFSDKIALSMYGAQPVTPEENPQIYRRVAPIVQPLCERMGLPMPRLWAAMAAYSWPFRITCAANGACPAILIVRCPLCRSMMWKL